MRKLDGGSTVNWAAIIRWHWRWLASLLLLAALTIPADAAPLHLRVLVRTNDVATGSGTDLGFPDGVFTYAPPNVVPDHQFGPPVAASGGYFAFPAAVQLRAANGAYWGIGTGIWGGVPGSLATLLRQGSPAPGLGTNTQPWLMNVSELGQVAFYGQATLGAGLWLGDPGAVPFPSVELVQRLTLPFSPLFRPVQTANYIYVAQGATNALYNVFNGQTKVVSYPGMAASVFGPGVTLSTASGPIALTTDGRLLLQGNTSDGTNRLFLANGFGIITPVLSQGDPAPGVPNRKIGIMNASGNDQGDVAVLTRLTDNNSNPVFQSALFAGPATNLRLLAQIPFLVGGGTFISRSNHVYGFNSAATTGFWKLPGSTNETLSFTALPAKPYPPLAGQTLLAISLNALGQYVELYGNTGQVNQKNPGDDLWLFNPGQGWTNVARSGTNLVASGETIRVNDIGFVGGTGGGYATGLADDGTLVFSIATHIIAGDFAPRPVVELIALEVNQAVQDWNNSVLLVENKKTYVRAFVQTPDGAQDNVLVKGARLRGFRNGAQLAGSPLIPINPGDAVLASTNVAARRHQLHDSLVYWVPHDWLNGTIELRFEWQTGEVTYREPAEPGGAAADGRVRVSFQRGTLPEVKWIRVAYTNAAGSRIEPEISDAGELGRRLVAIFPISDYRPQYGLLTWPARVPPQAKTNLSQINRMLERMREVDGCGDDCNRLYYAFMLGDLGGGRSNARPGTHSTGWLPTYENDFARNRHAHELGHLLGHSHAVDSTLTNPGQPKRGYCSETADAMAEDFPFFHLLFGGKKPTLGPMDQGPDSMAWGLDTYSISKYALMENQVVNPTNTYELMGYCGSEVTRWRWVSTYTYTNLFHALTNRFPAPAGGGGAFLAAAAADYLLFSGEIDVVTESASLDPVLSIRRSNPPPPPGQGDYLLRLRNGAGAVLTDIPFAPQFGEADAPDIGEDTLGTFAIAVVANPSIRRVEILHAGQVILMRQASANAPTVAVLSPNGGETLANDPVLLQWQGNDPDGDALSYVVQYSSDGGQTWETLALDLQQQTYSVSFDQLKGTDQGRIRVQASDGFNTASDMSDANFTVANHAPNLAVLSPADNELVVGDQQLVLRVDISDSEDGRLPDNQVQWTSSIDGALGNGPELILNARNLSEGDHLITITSTDSDGASSTRSFRLRVRREVTPLLEINRDGDLVSVAWPAALAEFVLEWSDGLLPDGWTPVPHATEIAAGMKRVSLPAANAQTFFRLRKP